MKNRKFAYLVLVFTIVLIILLATLISVLVSQNRSPEVTGSADKSAAVNTSSVRRIPFFQQILFGIVC